MSTVVAPDVATVDKLSTVERSDFSTVDISDQSTVDTLNIWVTEQDVVVPHGRVRRISVPQDVINSAEESVYETLRTAGDGDPSPVVEAGYDYLAKQTHLSKRTIQRIVEKLIDKDFIAIERPADIYRRTSTTYRVFSAKVILERHAQKGRFHVAKQGPGFAYVRRLGL
jgi:predicted transcriptional regulator